MIATMADTNRRILLAARARTSVFKEERGNDTVVLKVLAHDATSGDVERLENDLAFCSALEIPGLRKGIGRTVVDGCSAIVLAYVEGHPLTPTRITTVEDIAKALEVVAAVARVLAELHARRIVHRDVKPSNVILDDATSTTTMIDFGLAARIPAGLEALPPSEAVDGTLAYIAPEQTGRMGRRVDGRADLYSLGAMLYELLAGAPPFGVGDAARLVHAHLATRPESLERVDPLIPTVVARLVARLLAKDPEDRYQSALGVVADLERCAMALRAHGVVEDFELGEQDTSSRFELPNKLYGRTVAIAALESSLADIEGGARELVLVEGWPGVGKTAVVRTLETSVNALGGHFAEGKFDSLRRDVPYDAPRAAFGALVRSVLALDEDSLARIRKSLDAELRGSGAVLAAIVPGLGRLVATPPAPELGGSEAKHRLHYLARTFVRILSDDRPVVLFLDDLQWADLASLDLLQALLDDATPARLLVVGGLRTSETSGLDMVRDYVAAIRGVGVPVRNIAIEALDPPDVQALVADATKVPFDEARQLAESIYQRTRGNAFFVRRILTAMHARGRLEHDPKARRWRWGDDALDRLEIGDDVAALLDAELGALDERALRLMAIAAAIGPELDLATLAAVAEETPEQARADLAPALAGGLLVALGRPAAWSAESIEDATALAVRFVHDRVQHGAYARNEPASRPSLHRKIARLLAGASAGSTDRTFEIASQFALGAAAIEGAERRDVASRLTEAGARAIATAAHDQASHFLRVALTLLGDSPFVADPRVALRATSLLAESEYLRGRLDEADALASAALEHARTPAERFPPLETRILSATARNEMPAALALGLDALHELGAPMPRHPSMPWVVARLVSTRIRLLGKSPEDIEALPEMTDPAALAAMKVCKRTVPAAFRSAGAAFPLLVFTMVELSLRYGNSSASCFGWGSYAITLSGVLGEYDAGLAFGQLGLRLADRFGDPRQTPGAHFIWGNFLIHWKKPLDECLEPLREAYRIGMESGDLFTAVWAAMYRITWMHAAGAPLPVLEEELDRATAISERDRGAVALHAIMRQVFASFAGRSRDPARLNGDHVDEVALRAQVEADPEAVQAFTFHYYRLVLAVSFGDNEAALRIVTEVESRAEAATGMPFVPLLVYYASLARFAAHRHESLGLATRLKVERAMRDYRKWATHDPAGKRDRLLVLEGAYARATGDRTRARSAFEEAADLAARANRFDVEGTALELAAEVVEDDGFSVSAAKFRERAARAWGRIGATAKVERLLRGAPSVAASEAPASDQTATVTNSSSAPAIDLAAVMKASVAMSAEVALPKLLARSMEILVENAGAQRGVLVLADGDRLSAIAERDIDGMVRVGEPIPLAEAKGLVDSVVRRVARTEEPEVIDDAQEEPSLRNHPWVARGVRSILCAPLKHQGKLAGVLYLENNLTSSAFTPARVELLTLLGAQAAVAIENARLYAEQAALLSAHERFVPHEFLESLGRTRILDVELGDSVMKEMSILCSDIRGFTTHVAGMSPEENIGFINRYLRSMEPPIVSAGGFVEEYVGDEIMALFEPPTDRAIDAALGMLRALEELNAERGPGRAIRIGIGVNTGRLTLGTIGGGSRIKCGVIGDSVNVAARLESATKRYGVPLLVTDDTLVRASSVSREHVRRVDCVRVVGRSEPVEIHEVYAADTRERVEAKDAMRGEWAEALRLYASRDWNAARERFAGYERSVGGDSVAAIFVDRCARWAHAAPADDWDGVFNLETK